VCWIQDEQNLSKNGGRTTITIPSGKAINVISFFRGLSLLLSVSDRHKASGEIALDGRELRRCPLFQANSSKDQIV